jgi:(E)-4-hydroxy-3-methylbut-2-enyl-diphosphate synthase
VGDVPVGGGNPIVVQSMTNTDTADIPETIEQVHRLAAAGSELVRITVNNKEAAKAVPAIIEGLDKRGVNVPLIGDFHFNGHVLLTEYPETARLLAKYRINPGNTGTRSRDKNFVTIIEQAIKWEKPVRIGVNWGSLDQQLLAEQMDKNNMLPEPKSAKEVMMDTMIESAMRSTALAEEVGLPSDKIIVSCKLIRRAGSDQCLHAESKLIDYPLHLGLTEAGMGMKGMVASSVALSVLLQQGIGDTIRVSLTPMPNGPTAPRRCECASRSCSRWASAISSRRWRRVRAADAPRAPTSRSWPTRSRTILSR